MSTYILFDCSFNGLWLLWWKLLPLHLLGWFFTNEFTSRRENISQNAGCSESLLLQISTVYLQSRPGIFCFCLSQRKSQNIVDCLEISNYYLCKCLWPRLRAWMLTPPGRLKVWKHEWYHVVTNCQGHVLSPSGLPKVAKKCQKKPKFAFPYKYC